MENRQRRPINGLAALAPASAAVLILCGHTADAQEPPAPTYPCLEDESFRAFDFWLGTWDVHLPNGDLAGSNSITSAESGCVLQEQWAGASGGTGSSINYLDKTTDEWVQVWNSEGGAQISIRGGMTEDGMLLKGRIHYVGRDATALLRGLWTPLEDGRVRQFFEQSDDDGVTWAPWFEGFYTRQEETQRGN